MFEPEGMARFDALVVGDDGTNEAQTAVALAGGRVIASVGWGEALARLDALANRPLVVLDTRAVGDEQLAATLYRIDGLAAGRDLAIVAGIEEPQIDIVAGGLMLCRHDILCRPRPLDWIGAITLSQVAEDLLLHDRVSESEAARLARLNAEVARIADVLARLSKRVSAESADGVGDHASAFAAEPLDRTPVSAADIRQVIRARRLRDRHFGPGLFEDPGWDMMLDLYAAHLEHAQVSVSSLCIAAAVAPTTALRWISRMTAAGLFAREPDPFDRRRAFVSLTERGLEGMNRYAAAARALGLPLV